MFSKKTLISLIVCLAVVLSLLVGAAAWLIPAGFFGDETTAPTQTQLPTTETTGTTGTTGTTAPPTTGTTAPPTTGTTAPPTQPPVEKVSSATIANVGDFLMHLPVINTATVTDGNYDFANVFTYFGSYVTAADYAVGNLETTLAGTDNGYQYSGYPQFNCPDGIVSSLQAAGFDMLLTANNHTYDTRAIGFYRTQQVMQELGMDYLGTVDSLEIPLWQIREINGIRIGMICYTYETDANPDKVALNGIPMSEETKSLIGTFYPYSAEGREAFYGEMEQQIAQMQEAGAEAVVLYVHWGEEYQTKQNAAQSEIAQKMCDLGVDVIVGGHPHVVQPMELLTSTIDAAQKTVCLYSTGNILSNQRIVHMDLKTGHTEDGVLFSFTFAKYSDGTVILESADILPTWVDLHYNAETGNNVYSILPLDTAVEDWKNSFLLDDVRLNNAQASYNRTMAIVGKGLEQVQAYLSQLVADTEAALGVKP